MDINLVVVIIALLVSFSLSIKKIEWGIYLVLFTLPLYTVRASIGPLPTTVLEMAFLGLIAGWFVSHRSDISSQWKNVISLAKTYPFVTVSVMLFLLSATIGIFIAPDKLSALGVWRAYYIEPFLFFLICLSALDTPTKLRAAWWSLLTSGLTIASIAIVQKFTGWHIPAAWLVERRVTSIYPYPNAVGLYLAPLIALALPFCRYYLLREGWKERMKGICVGLIAVMMFVAIIFSKTEAALVTLVVVGTGYGLLAAGKRIRYLTLLLVCISGITIVLSPIVQSTLSEKLLFQDWSGFVRRTVWHESWAMLQDHRMFGAGLSGYQTAMAPYHKATFLEIFMFPHTIVFNVWSELGLLGLAAVLLLIGWCSAISVTIGRVVQKNKQTINAQWHTVVLFASIMIGITLLIHGLVDVPYFKNDLSMMTWFFLAMVCLTYHQSRQQFSPTK